MPHYLLLAISLLTLTVSPISHASDYDDSSEGVRCESYKNRTEYCNIDTRNGVDLIETHSRTQCIEGQTWGYDRRGVWVNAGCRGTFVSRQRIYQSQSSQGAQRGRSFNGGYQQRQSDGEAVLCESVGKRQTYCEVRTRGGVELVNQLSRSPCVQGQTWDYDRRGIWVSEGCRAEFIAY